MYKFPINPAAPPSYAMCFDPATLAIAAIVAVGVGTGISAIGAVQEGELAKAQSQEAARVLRQQADHERAQAGIDEGDFRRAQSRLEGARRAQLGGSGVVGGTGTPLLVAADISREIELQALRIRSGGELSGTRFEQQAIQVKDRGSAAERAGRLRAGALLFQGAGQAFGIGSGLR